MAAKQGFYEFGDGDPFRSGRIFVAAHLGEITLELRLGDGDLVGLRGLPNELPVGVEGVVPVF